MSPSTTIFILNWSNQKMNADPSQNTKRCIFLWHMLAFEIWVTPPKWDSVQDIFRVYCHNSIGKFFQHFVKCVYDIANFR